MEQKLITLKNGQVKAIFEYFAKLLAQDGKNAMFSYMIYKNAEILSERYKVITDALYDENADEEFQKFKRKAQELVIKYADRNEQAEIVRDENGNPKITEQIVEYKDEAMKLAEENKALIDEHNKNVKRSMEVLETSIEYNLYVIKIEDFPGDTQPAIVGIFGI